jgi:hypothetical protein
MIRLHESSGICAACILVESDEPIAVGDCLTASSTPDNSDPHEGEIRVTHVRVRTARSGVVLTLDRAADVAIPALREGDYLFRKGAA